MTPPITNHLKAARRKGGLTQADLAQLLGIDGASTISRYEAGHFLPSLPAAFALQAIFDLALPDLFPLPYAQIESATMRAAVPLARAAERRTGPTAAKRRRLFARMAARARGSVASV